MDDLFAAVLKFRQCILRSQNCLKGHKLRAAGVLHGGSVYGTKGCNLFCRMATSRIMVSHALAFLAL